MAVTRERAAKRRARVLRKMLLAWTLAVASTCALRAAAQPGEARAIEGHVVAVQDADIIVDLAGARGAKVGDKLELWRGLTLRHPVTGKQVSERFSIGKLRLVQLGEQLAIAEVLQFDRAPEPGDIVILRGAPAPAPVPAPARRGERVASQDVDALEVARMFEAQRGRMPEERIAAYQRFVQTRPDSRFAMVLREEAAMLRKMVQDWRARSQAEPIDAPHFDGPERALAGRPLDIGVRVRGKPAGVVLHLRQAGERHYASLPMASSGEDYYRVTVPAARMRPPGVEYFIEASNKKGTTRPIVGEADDPWDIDVQELPPPKAFKPPRVAVAAWTDYADYNRWRGNDVAWQTEGYFEMRFGDAGARALRSGFGVYRGIGGSLEELDELGKSARAIGLTYGYLELEVGFNDFVGMAGRGIVGLINSGVTGGVHGFVRIGNDLRTNLVLGGEFLGGVGLRGIAELQLFVFEDWPMLFRTEVTNQPAGSSSNLKTVRPIVDGALPEQTALGTNDVGGRGIVQVGYRIVDELVVSVRGSYQGRTIKHSGPGLGGGVSYAW